MIVLSEDSQSGKAVATKGLSLHLGVDSVDRTYWGDALESLRSCRNDARTMYEIAVDAQFEAVLLKDIEATRKVFEQFLVEAAKLKSGDSVMITFSGHGTELLDVNGDEPLQWDGTPGRDQTICLYDNNLIDDELYGMLGNLRAGVQVCVILDSCHSATAVSLFSAQLNRFSFDGRSVLRQPRGASVVGLRQLVERRGAEFAAAQAQYPLGNRQPLNATVISMSACADDQVALDGSNENDHGLFTSTLLSVWNNHTFAGFQQFIDRIREQSYSAHMPEINFYGPPNPQFEKKGPFVL